MNRLQSGRRRAACVPLAAVAALSSGVAAAADLNAVNHAGAIASGVVVGSAAPSLGFAAVLQTFVGLAVVIGLVFGCAWLARRLGFQPVRRGGPLKVVASVAVGGKESATIVEIGDTWLVLGVAPGNVRLLHTVPAGTAGALAPDTLAGTPPSAGAGLPGTFGQRFRDALANEAGKRFGRGRDR